MSKYLAAAKVGAILQSFAPTVEAKVKVIVLFNNAVRTSEDQCLRTMCRALSDGVIFGKWPWLVSTSYACPDPNCGYCGEFDLCVYPLCPRNAKHVVDAQLID